MPILSDSLSLMTFRKVAQTKPKEHDAHDRKPTGNSQTIREDNIGHSMLKGSVPQFCKAVFELLVEADQLKQQQTLFGQSVHARS